MQFDKKVSVCINAYNSEATIKETLESVLNQTYSDLQVIVVDDCSTDRTAEIVKGIGDSRVELYSLEENGNISNANNEAISHAVGDYIAHLDSDDVWLPDKLEKQVAFLEQHPEYGACFTHVVQIDEDGNRELENAYFETIFNIGNMTQAEFIRFFYENANRLCHSTLLIRKSVQDAVGGHDLSLLYLHDYDLWVRLAHKFPIYIMQEPLVKYRVRSNSNSQPTDEKQIAHDEEFARVVYGLIDNCPDKLFEQAFSDKFRFKGEHTSEDIQLEKAFLLLDGFLSIKGNQSMGLRKFDELFSQKKYIQRAKKNFGFSLRDFYNLHKNEIYYNPELRKKLDSVSQELELTENHCRDLADIGDNLRLQNGVLNDQLAAARAQNAELTARYNLVINSKSMKITKPVRNVKTFCTVYNELCSRRLSNGRKAKAKIVLFGFFGHNLGDDMFFDMLFKRYPDTLFCILHTADYAFLCSKYPNVKLYNTAESYVAKFNRIGRLLGKKNWFESLLYKSADAAVHIGGSIYQQIADWQVDIEQRRERNAYFKKFFAISNNFGPYKSKDYLDFWADQFRKSTDVCFRDIYSYSLFTNIPTVRYAPDILFSFSDNAPIEKEKRVAFSIINPRFRVRSFTEEQSEAYEKKMLELIEYYADSGYSVSLLGFCSLEEDRAEIEKLYMELPYKVREKVRCKYFTDDYKAITDEIKKSETVIATRFHAMVLGYIFGKKVVPICYSNKMSDVIDDLALAVNPVTFKNIGDYTAQQISEKANKISNSKVSELRELSLNQFYVLDRFIEESGGTVAR